MENPDPADTDGDADAWTQAVTAFADRRGRALEVRMTNQACEKRFAAADGPVIDRHGQFFRIRARSARRTRSCRSPRLTIRAGQATASLSRVHRGSGRSRGSVPV